MHSKAANSRRRRSVSYSSLPMASYCSSASLQIRLLAASSLSGWVFRTSSSSACVFVYVGLDVRAIIPPFLAPFLSAKRALDLVRENQQSSAHNFVKDFSSIYPESRRRSPLKKGAVTEIPLEYGKTEVQIPFEPLQAAISSMELPKNYENKKLPNTLRRLAFLPFHL